MNELELLNLKVGNITVKDLTGLSFLGWVAKRLDGLKTYDVTTQELVRAIQVPVLGRLSDDSKVDILRKMEKLGILPPQ